MKTRQDKTRRITHQFTRKISIFILAVLLGINQNTTLLFAETEKDSPENIQVYFYESLEELSEELSKKYDGKTPCIGQIDPSIFKNDFLNHPLDDREKQRIVDRVVEELLQTPYYTELNNQARNTTAASPSFGVNVLVRGCEGNNCHDRQGKNLRRIVWRAFHITIKIVGGIPVVQVLRGEPAYNFLEFIEFLIGLRCCTDDESIEVFVYPGLMQIE